MSASLFHYFGEQGADHNGKLHWSSALDGLPFRGAQAPVLKQDELATKVAVTFDFHSQTFCLADKEQKQKYDWVMERIVNGWFYLHFAKRIEDKDSGDIVRVYIEWSQRYGELTPAGRANNTTAAESRLNGSSLLAGLQADY